MSGGKPGSSARSSRLYRERRGADEVGARAFSSQPTKRKRSAGGGPQVFCAERAKRTKVKMRSGGEARQASNVSRRSRDTVVFASSKYEARSGQFHRPRRGRSGAERCAQRISERGAAPPPDLPIRVAEGEELGPLCLGPHASEEGRFPAPHQGCICGAILRHTFEFVAVYCHAIDIMRPILDD